mmetsp:Transcript_11438/g.22918  ORF Transcript_11438/g.22918 Transcript_11438/m.22918 type:complete len:94 (+) Transcript_11438:2096-2377(+)
MTWYWTLTTVVRKTLSFVFVSTRTSSCCTLNETLPACCSQGHQMRLKPGDKKRSNLPSLSTTTTSDVETHKQQGQHMILNIIVAGVKNYYCLY